MQDRAKEGTLSADGADANGGSGSHSVLAPRSTPRKRGRWDVTAAGAGAGVTSTDDTPKAKKSATEDAASVSEVYRSLFFSLSLFVSLSFCLCLSF